MNIATSHCKQYNLSWTSSEHAIFNEMAYCFNPYFGMCYDIDKVLWENAATVNVLLIVKNLHTLF